MSDLREMADTLFMWHHPKPEEAKTIRMKIQKPRTHEENAEFFFDPARTSIQTERKAQLSPVFAMPYGQPEKVSQQ